MIRNNISAMHKFAASFTIDSINTEQSTMHIQLRVNSTENSSNASPKISNTTELFAKASSQDSVMLYKKFTNSVNDTEKPDNLTAKALKWYVEWVYESIIQNRNMLYISFCVPYYR